jgi:hypothetical protein
MEQVLLLARWLLQQEAVAVVRLIQTRVPLAALVVAHARLLVAVALVQAVKEIMEVTLVTHQILTPVAVEERVLLGQRGVLTAAMVVQVQHLVFQEHQLLTRVAEAARLASAHKALVVQGVAVTQ